MGIFRNVFGDLREGRLLETEERFWLREGRVLEGRKSFEQRGEHERKEDLRERTGERESCRQLRERERLREK